MRIEIGANESGVNESLDEWEDIAIEQNNNQTRENIRFEWMNGNIWPLEKKKKKNKKECFLCQIYNF